MKRIKNKYIRLTEQDLSKIVKSAVEKELNMLLEYYAISRSDFQKNIKNQICQIVENWCLIRFCELTNNDVNNCKNHWKDELKAACKNAAIQKIKGNDSSSSRLKAICKVFDDLEINSDYNVVDEIIVDKFVKEQIDTNSEEYKQTINDFMNSCKDICISLATHKYREYIDNL